MSAPREQRAPAAACACCGDRGVVSDILGNPRPCSRCRVDAFMAWADRRCGAKPAGSTPAGPGEAA